MRWLDELNNITDADITARKIKADIRKLRSGPNSLQNRRQIKKLYEQLDYIQFKPDYLCVIIDREKDYKRACHGFSINGVAYHRLLGTNGGVKNSTIVFVSDKHGAQLRRRIDNGRDLNKELVPAKFESYKALTCSASVPVSMPHGVLIVNDCETQFMSDIIYINDADEGEPVVESRDNVQIELNESDGYGLMSPALAERWAKEMGLDYVPGGMNTRFAFEKGMVFCFDFIDFADIIAKHYIVKDAWGNDVDIRNVELILTTSMVKLWDSYSSFDHYIKCCEMNGYQFGVAKVCPQFLENERNLNYQFLQSYEFSDEDIRELIAPTVAEISDVLYADYRKTILFLKGVGLNDRNVEDIDDDYTKALMIDSRMLDDPYVQSRVFQNIKNRINEAKVGVIKVHGNYSIVSGDPYALCQSFFKIPVTGLLKAGEVYNSYWSELETEKVACFRAPMTCHNNIRLVTINKDSDAAYWYRHMRACTLFNAWDTAAHALNGMDKDGDLVMLTDDHILIEKCRELPALMCVQRKAAKKVVCEDDFIKANVDSFGDEIGKTTNRITSMFEVQSRFSKGSEAYEELDYRIKCGQLFQQNAIDKTKGIIAKPMPREWYDRHHVALIENAAERRLYSLILADKKPYFMRYIYPDLMKRHNTYIKNAEKKALREFNMSIGELVSESSWKLSGYQRDFIRSYRKGLPVGVGECVVNRICEIFESLFDGYVGRRSAEVEFDYTIMKSRSEYSKSQYYDAKKLFEQYNTKLREYAVFVNRERIDNDESISHMHMMRAEFRNACDAVCSNEECLCDILLDICYQKNCTKKFVWDMCGEQIVKNLLNKNAGIIHFPVLDAGGDIDFNGQRFSFLQKEIGVNE